MTTKIYDRQNGEPEAAWTVFSIFRAEGRDRKLKNLKASLEELGVGYLSREVPRWRARWDWDQRLKTYDEEIEFRILREASEDVRTREVSFSKSGRLILTIVAEWIQDFDQRVKSIIEDDPTADPLGIQRALESGAGLDWLRRAADLLARTQQIAGEMAPVKVQVTNKETALLIEQVFKSRGAELEAILDVTATLAEPVTPKIESKTGAAD